jgi:hypothetical protein
MTTTATYRERVISEIDALPDEYLPFVLQLVQTFRESVTLKPALASFKQGWHEARNGDITPLKELWEDIDAG